MVLPVLLFYLRHLAETAGGGGNIGKLLIMEFTDNENAAFADILNMLKKYPDFQRIKLKDETVLSFPGFEICPERRKICSEIQEISLTTKEFDILYILAVNEGRVVTYEQIYQNVWNSFPTGRENNIVGYHVRNLRKKLCIIPMLSLQCIREVGYCFSIVSENNGST